MKRSSWFVSRKWWILVGVLTVLAVLGVVLAAMVGQAATRPPSSAANMRGVSIIGADESDGRWSISLQHPGDEPIPAGTYDAAVVAVDEDTRLLRRAGEDYEQVGVESVLLARAVDVWFRGPVAESYPVQATALCIVVLEE